MCLSITPSSYFDRILYFEPRCLVIARESGTVQRYSLPHLVIEMKFVIQCRPQARIADARKSGAKNNMLHMFRCFKRQFIRTLNILSRR